MSRARLAAWEMYVTHVGELVNAQAKPFIGGHPVRDIIIKAPTSAQIQAIERAMHDARLDTISAVLLPVIRSIDRIDNAHSKSPLVAEIRASLQEACDALQAMKVSPQPETKADDRQ